MSIEAPVSMRKGKEYLSFTTKGIWGLILILIPKISATADSSSKLPGLEVRSSSITPPKAGTGQQTQFPLAPSQHSGCSCSPFHHYLLLSGYRESNLLVINPVFWEEAKDLAPVWRVSFRVRLIPVNRGLTIFCPDSYYSDLPLTFGPSLPALPFDIPPSQGFP